MAISSTTVLAGANAFTADVIATADADTILNIAHGLGAVPLRAMICGFGEQVPSRLSDWMISSLTNTTVQVAKTTAIGSGDINIQCRVQVSLPHSLFR